MNETEWLMCTDPHRLLTHMRGHLNGWKLRRLGVECCRLMDGLFTSDLPRQIIELAEQLSERETDRERLREQFRHHVRELRLECESVFGPRNWLMHDIEELLRTEQEAVNVASIFLAWIAEGQAFQNTFALFNCVVQRVEGSNEMIVTLIHDVVGNPFRPVAFADSWRSETVVAVATSIYTERAFDRMPILADALEEAGCDHLDILDHCRGPGPHVRGCWVVDLVLGKT